MARGGYGILRQYGLTGGDYTPLGSLSSSRKDT